MILNQYGEVKSEIFGYNFNVNINGNNVISGVKLKTFQKKSRKNKYRIKKGDWVILEEIKDLNMLNGKTHIITSKLNEKEIENLKLKSFDDKIEDRHSNWKFEGDPSDDEIDDNYIDTI